MKRRYKITIGLLALLTALAVAWFWIIGSTQNSLRLETPSNLSQTIIPVTATPYCALLAPGLNIKIDTGADISTLSDEDAERLKAMGFEIKESGMPISGRDGYGRYIFSLKRYTVSLPIGGYVQNTDSLGRRNFSYQGKPDNYIHNVDFAPTADTLSTLGLDVLRKFKLEFDFEEKCLKLHDSIPTSYQHVSDLLCNIKLFDKLWSGKRIYMILSVNQHPQIYQVDTGLQRTAIKMPASESRRSNHPLRIDSIHTMLKSYSAKVDDKAWVEFGNRCGTKSIYYYDNTEDDYQFNPLNVFDQDLLLDIEGQALYFRPSSN